jgi:hypothetical protein
MRNSFQWNFRGVFSARNWSRINHPCGNPVAFGETCRLRENSADGTFPYVSPSQKSPALNSGSARWSLCSQWARFCTSPSVKAPCFPEFSHDGPRQNGGILGLKIAWRLASTIQALEVLLKGENPYQSWNAFYAANSGLRSCANGPFGPVLAMTARAERAHPVSAFLLVTCLSVGRILIVRIVLEPDKEAGAHAPRGEAFRPVGSHGWRRSSPRLPTLSAHRAAN